MVVTDLRTVLDAFGTAAVSASLWPRTHGHRCGRATSARVNVPGQEPTGLPPARGRRHVGDCGLVFTTGLAIRPTHTTSTATSC